ncbi:SapC family protein [Sphingomonas sp. H39-1-10]|uniref:SapC family protein n=1 Tax=Sphingomonas pollutisoli TaxID=3030829 RepID=UPI0023B9F328|nr:SapC family protein [Sphingomonas pollutisoli]MDF0487745.1 SapC family protein [Sphingomonas pollutisoli]
MTSASSTTATDDAWEPLASDRHGSWRLAAGDMAHAVTVPFVPVLIAEFAAAARVFPIVFSNSDPSPIAILGLDQHNLFVKDGVWESEFAARIGDAQAAGEQQADIYVPAYIRRHPFALLRTTDEQHVLAIDKTSPLLRKEGEEGTPLFENGKPSATVASALQFCEAFRQQAEATMAFVRALEARELLIERRANITLHSGRSLGLTGFRIIDADKFARLDGPTIVEWHAKGWLAPVHFHLASLSRLQALARRQADADAEHDGRTNANGQSESQLPTASA